MGKNTKFKWLMDAQISRGGVKLETDKEYDLASFPPEKKITQAVVDEWVKTGAAKYTKEDKEKVK